ncbi:hypothetical protein DL771_003264 [Monosporascus sp. 5C6A]|nr:hypothetical protein DL771_003264 [Monosporascus sp. 5C6A]
MILDASYGGSGAYGCQSHNDGYDSSDRRDNHDPYFSGGGGGGNPRFGGQTSSGGFADERHANSAYGGGYGGEPRAMTVAVATDASMTPGTVATVPFTETADQVIPAAEVMEEVFLTMMIDMALADETTVRVTTTIHPHDNNRYDSGRRIDDSSYGGRSSSYGNDRPGHLDAYESRGDRRGNDGYGGYSSAHGGGRPGHIGGYGLSGGRNDYNSHDSSEKSDSHDQNASSGGFLGCLLGGSSNGHHDSSKKQDETITDKIIQRVADYAKKKW